MGVFHGKREGREKEREGERDRVSTCQVHTVVDVVTTACGFHKDCETINEKCAHTFSKSCHVFS